MASTASNLIDMPTRDSLFWFRFLLLLLLLPSPMLVTSKNSRRWDPGSNVEDFRSSPPVKLHKYDKNHVVLDNGIVNVTLSAPGGLITGIEYHGIDNLLEWRNKETQRGYWDLVWSNPDYPHNNFDVIEGKRFRVVSEDENQIELSFSRTWNPSFTNHLPINIDKRYVMLRGSPGFYTYAIYDHLEGWPDFDICQTRVVFKLEKDLFHYMAISDDRQRIMPTAADRSRGQELDYPEAVRLSDDLNDTFLRGEVDDKYQYSANIKDSRVHGWISPNPRVGFWVITPSDEFRSGGPLKQELTCHVGPTALSVFFSDHYTGKDFTLKVRDGEPWKKVYGPIFIYLNSGSPKYDFHLLWDDAKEQMLVEARSWPYNFLQSTDFLHEDQRGIVTGRLLVSDRYVDHGLINAAEAYVGLAPVGEAGSWQRNSKDYQFWNQTDANGNFVIRAVHPGSYNLFGWVPGYVGDYRYNVILHVLPGDKIILGDIVYAPPRNGPTLWEIGIADRIAAEFFVPDPYPNLVNHLYVNHTEKFRQYGLWERYTDFYPKNDVVYRIGTSDYKKDWFFAHVNRHMGHGIYAPTTWRIEFYLSYVPPRGTYTLRIALATGNVAKLKVGINKDPSWGFADFRTGMIGRDNSIARHGIHGLYWLYSIVVPNYLLHRGTNTIFLQQATVTNKFCGIMYDYIRLEGPV